MKIELNDVNDVRDFLLMLDPVVMIHANPRLADQLSSAKGLSGTGQFDAELAHARAAQADEPNGRPADIAQPEVLTGEARLAAHEAAAAAADSVQPEVMSDAEVETNIAQHARDADGAPHDTDWHSAPAKLTGKGLWRARRGRDEDAYKAWLLAQAVSVAEAAIAADAEPIATETHALPQDEGTFSTDPLMDIALRADADKLQALGADPGPTLSDLDQADSTAATVDLEALVAASQKAAEDASDSHVDLLNVCRDFTTKRGHAAFVALKAAVAPDGESGQGKAVQQLTPGERRLLQACIANYPG